MRGLLWHDLRFLCRLRRVMNHRVGVFHADAVRARLAFENAHERVVVLAVLPVALEFEQGRNGRQPDGTSLHHTRERGFLRGWRCCSAAVFHHVDVVARAEHFDGRPRDANLGP